MKNEKLLKRIKQTEKELEKLKSELNEDPKVPFWGIFETGCIEYIVDHSNSWYVCGDNCERGVCGSFWNEDSFKRIAEPEEIEAHLIKLAKDKGLVPGSSFESLTGQNIFIIFGNYSYNSEADSLFLGRWVIYNQGKWAKKIDGYPTKKELGVDEIGITFFGYAERFGRSLPHDWFKKMETLGKLFAVADYVNEGWKPCWSGPYQTKWFIDYNMVSGLSSYHYGDYSQNPVHFKSSDAVKKAIEIFKHWGEEQELIDFFK